MPFVKIRRRAASPSGLTPDEERFARGTRSVADLIAPAAFEVTRDHVRLEYQYARSLMVTGYPRTVGPGWLAPLIDFEAPLDISIHIRPLDTGQMVKTLSRKLVQLHSSRLLAARGGRLADPEREVAYEDAERLRDSLQRGDERVFSVSLYLLIRANSLAAAGRPDSAGAGHPGRPPGRIAGGLPRTGQRLPLLPAKRRGQAAGP